MYQITFKHEQEMTLTNQIHSRPSLVSGVDLSI